MSTQEPAVRALAESIVALGQGPLGTPSQLKARLTLPEGLTWSYDTGKRTLVEVSGATLTLSMRNGTWEPPLGNSQRDRREPTVESIELRGPGSLGLTPPKNARVVATQNFQGPAVVVSWPGNFYLAEAQLVEVREPNANTREPKLDEAWYLGRFVGRAPFHYAEKERRSLETALIDISRALAEGGLDLPAYMAKTYTPLRHANPEQVGYGPPKRDEDERVLREPAAVPEILLYDFGAALVLVGSSELSVRFVGPMKMPAFFAAHRATMIETSFAHDVGQMVRVIERPGLSIRLNDYFFGEQKSRRDAEMGPAADVKLLALSIAARQDR